MTDNTHPNALPGEPGTSQPDRPQPIPAVFTERGVDIRSVGPTTAPALQQARDRAAQAPNSPADVRLADMTSGTQPGQAANLAAALRRR